MEYKYNRYTYTADDEDPKCHRCDNCFGPQCICDECGPQFWWKNYIRTERIKEREENKHE